MPKDSTQDELELGDYLAALRRRWLWLLVPLIAFPTLVVVFTSSQPLNYEATARVVLGTSAAQDFVAAQLNLNSEFRSRDLLNEINLAEGDDTTSLVRLRLGLAPTAKLPKGSIEADPEADVLSFTFTGPTAAAAALTANTWATAYVELKQSEAEISISQAVTQLRDRLDLLRAERSEIRRNLEALEDSLVRTIDEAQRATLQLQINRETSVISGDLNLVDAQIEANIQTLTQLQLSGEVASGGTARVAQNAAPPIGPTNAPLSRNLVIGLLVGGLVGVGLALLVDNLDRSVNEAEDIQRMGLTVLGTIPEASRRVARTGLSTIAQTRPGSSMADGYQKIRTALQFATLGKDIKTILVTSPQQSDGKTTTATNLALALANVESRVVLADIDFRRPQIHMIFNTELIPGISDALVGQTTLRQVAVNHPELSTTLVAMPAGTQPPNPATFLVSSRFSGLLADLRNQADITILDAPPVLPVADALSIASQVDGVILVVRAGTTTFDEVTSAVDSVIRSGGQLLGVVVNHARHRASSYGDPLMRRRASTRRAASSTRSTPPRSTPLTKQQNRAGVTQAATEQPPSRGMEPAGQPTQQQASPPAVTGLANQQTQDQASPPAVTRLANQQTQDQASPPVDDPVEAFLAPLAEEPTKASPTPASPTDHSASAFPSMQFTDEPAPGTGEPAPTQRVPVIEVSSDDGDRSKNEAPNGQQAKGSEPSTKPPTGTENGQDPTMSTAATSGPAGGPAPPSVVATPLQPDPTELANWYPPVHPDEAGHDQGPSTF